MQSIKENQAKRARGFMRHFISGNFFVFCLYHMDRDFFLVPAGSG